MGILDSITKIFDPLISITEKQYDNNYLFYGIIGMFVAIMGLIGYGFFLLFT